MAPLASAPRQPRPRPRTTLLAQLLSLWVSSCTAPADEAARDGEPVAALDAALRPTGHDAGSRPHDASSEIADAVADGAADVDVEAQAAPHPAPVAQGCITDLTTGRRTVQCGEISHELSVPERCLSEACGLILDIHGGTMSGAQEDKNTRLASLGAGRGYVVIQPSAITRLFYSGDVLPQWVPELDDALVMRFSRDVIASFHIDPRRIHVTGFSQGSLMTWRLICAHAELFASAAPAAGSHPHIPGEDCAFSDVERPAVELPILNMQGTLDPLSPFDQALVRRAAVRAAFEMDEGVVLAQDAQYVHTRYRNARNVVFEFVQHDYRTDAQATFGPWHQALEGHCYPGSDDFQTTLPGQILPYACTPPTAFNWGELVLRFFEAHPKQ